MKLAEVFWTLWAFTLLLVLLIGPFVTIALMVKFLFF